MDIDFRTPPIHLHKLSNRGEGKREFSHKHAQIKTPKIIASLAKEVMQTEKF